MRRSLVTLVLGAVVMSVPNLAAAQQPATVGLAGALAAADLATSDLAPAIAASSTTREEAQPRFETRRSGNRAGLAALSVTSAALQGLDAYTTLTAIKHGAVEANPLMRGAVRNPAVLIAVKSSMTAATIYAAQRLWPRNKVAAVALLAVSNGVMATVVAHNMSVIRQLR
ncbi:MAG: DUF5658 family protein [Vicinamibacterales bacterium]